MKPLAITPLSLNLSILLAGLAIAGPLFAAPKINPDAKALANQLSPVEPARKAGSSSVASVSKKMISAIELLEKSYTSNGPNPESLLDKAFSFRPDVGRWEKLLVSNAVHTAWEEAHAMGLFDDRGKFGNRIYQGRHAGSRAMFELIIPAELYPPASNQIANLKLIPEEAKRTDFTNLTPREQAHKAQLEKMVDEAIDHRKLAAYDKAGRDLNALGQSSKDQNKIWEEAVKNAGESANQPPNIRIDASMEASPSRMTENRWRVGCDFLNASNHPTEVKAEIWLIGYTDEKRDHYLMARSEHALKLRAGESRELDVFTRSEKSYKGKADDHDQLSKKERKKSRVRYRGYAIRVYHDNDVVSFAGSDSLLTGYVNPANEDSPLERLPKF